VAPAAPTAPPAATPLTTAPAAPPAANASDSQEQNTCYNLYSSMTVNPLQLYKDSPDSAVFGFGNCKLCTNGTMHCTTLLHSGKSELIASHIHVANNGKDGNSGEGPPVINFCGNDGTGFIRDGTPYTQTCAVWDGNGAAVNRNVPGALVANFNKGMTLAERVRDIGKRPHMYYLNYHSLASWTRWYPTPTGIARGRLELQGIDL